MHLIISESFILRMILNIYRAVKDSLNNSFFVNIIVNLVKQFKIYFRSSIIIHIFTRKRLISEAWENSLVYRIVRYILLLPENIVKLLYKKCEKVFCVSIVYKVTVLAINNLHILTASVLFISLVAPFRWNNLYAFGMLVFLTFLLYIKPSVTGEEGIKVSAVSFYTVVFVLAVIVAQLFSVSPGESFKFLVFYTNCFMLVILFVSSIRTTTQLRNAIEVILAGITITALLGIFMSIIGVPADPSLTDTTANLDMPGRVYATIKNTNDYAESLLIFFPFYLAVIIYSKLTVKKVLFIAMAIPSFVAIMLTYSRTSWIGLVAATFIFVFFANKKMLIPLIALALFGLPFLPATVVNRIQTIISGDTSIGYRFTIFKTVMPIIKDYWFTGIGLGTFVFKNVVARYPIYTEGWIPPHSHNVFLHIWLESGIVGILSFFGWMIHLIKIGINKIRYELDKTIKYVIIACVSSLSGVLITGMGEYIWHEHRVMLLYWAVVGLLTAAVSLNGEPESQTPGYANIKLIH